MRLAILLALAAFTSFAADSALDAYLASYDSLALIPRSDWCNVKTDVTPAAVGDGVTDDTAALQAACDLVTDKKPVTRIVYLPPGTYRITGSLVLTQVQGGALIGHGGATRIVWDGPEGGRMLHSNGFGRSRHVGITWDGNGKAAVGVDHDSKTYYETRVRYQYCAFRNFTDAGIRVGHDQKVASAEMMFMDCRFDHCAKGISFLAFNDYDNAIERCVFTDCGSAVHCFRGNVYVRDCHFERSTAEDVLLPPHSHSLRRCTSVGSNAFVRPSQPGTHTFLLAIDQCRVTGWKDPRGAVQLANRGPVTIADSAFADPAAADSPVVNLLHSDEWDSTLITANLQTRNVQTAVKAGAKGKVVAIDRPASPLLIDTRADERWTHRPHLATKVFDAKVDFGAVGNGNADDTEAIRKTIAAAREAGHGAIAYLPVGTYRLTSTLELGAGDYSFGGTLAFRTILRWDGPADGTAVHAHNADGVTVEQLRVEAPKESKATSLLVTADQPGRIVLDSVWGGGAWQPDFAGLVLRDLPAGFRVLAPHVDGDARILNCGAAHVLIDNWYAGYAGPLLVTGPTVPGGFIGINSAVSSHCEPDLTVNDSGTIVIGDYYTEQTKCHLIARGQPGQPAGRVTISNAKLGCQTADKIRLEGYTGQVTISRANAMYYPTRLVASGGPETTLLLLGDTFNPVPPEYDLGGVRLVRVGCNVWNYKDKDLSQVLPDTDAPAAAVNRALDHFRALDEANFGAW